MRRLILLLLSLLILFLAVQVASAGKVLVIGMENTITPASDDILEGGLELAENEGYQAVVLTLNTPGGGLDETIRIIEIMGKSPVPVIGFVYPRGGKAWSAGTLILLSTDIAAMAPGTIIGSAQPVEMGAEGIKPINESKIINAVVARIKESARLHNRNVTAAELFVTQNLNLNAQEAKEMGVIEYTAEDIPGLLAAIDGVTVKGRKLETRRAEIVVFTPPLGLRLLDLLSNPILASLLLLVGIYALVFGLTSPGFGAEIFGVIAISLGLIGTGFSVNITALFLLLLGAVLVLAEFYTPGFGVLGLSGLVCLVLGSLFLLPLGYPRWYLPGEFQQSLAITIMTPTLILGILLVFAIYKMAQLRHKRPATGEIIGETAETLDTLKPGRTGYIRFEGEYWQASSDTEIPAHTKVEITGKDGAILKVKIKD